MCARTVLCLALGTVKTTHILVPDNMTIVDMFVFVRFVVENVYLGKDHIVCSVPRSDYNQAAAAAHKFLIENENDMMTKYLCEQNLLTLYTHGNQSAPCIFFELHEIFMLLNSFSRNISMDDKRLLMVVWLLYVSYTWLFD